MCWLLVDFSVLHYCTICTITQCKWLTLRDIHGTNIRLTVSLMLVPCMSVSGKSVEGYAYWYGHWHTRYVWSIILLGTGYHCIESIPHMGQPVRGTLPEKRSSCGAVISIALDQAKYKMEGRSEPHYQKERDKAGHSAATHPQSG